MIGNKNSQPVCNDFRVSNISCCVLLSDEEISLLKNPSHSSPFKVTVRQTTTTTQQPLVFFFLLFVNGAFRLGYP